MNCVGNKSYNLNITWKKCRLSKPLDIESHNRIGKVKLLYKCNLYEKCPCNVRSLNTLSSTFCILLRPLYTLAHIQTYKPVLLLLFGDSQSRMLSIHSERMKFGVVLFHKILHPKFLRNNTSCLVLLHVVSTYFLSEIFNRVCI